MKLLQIQDKKIGYRVGNKIKEELINLGLAKEFEATRKDVIHFLKNDIAIFKNGNTEHFLKVQTTKKGIKRIKFMDYLIPLNLIKDIAVFLKTGVIQAELKKKNMMNKKKVVFLKDFGMIQRNDYYHIYNNDIITSYGCLNIFELEKQKIVKIDEYPVIAAEFKLEDYYYSPNYEIIYDKTPTIRIGCKTFDKKDIIEFGYAINDYLVDLIEETYG